MIKYGKIDEVNRVYRWKNKNIETTVLQAQGVDIRIFQKDLSKEGHPQIGTFANYSEQGNYLFTTLLNYTNTRKRFDKISNFIDFKFNIKEQIEKPNEFYISRNIKQPLDVIINNNIDEVGNLALVGVALPSEEEGRVYFGTIDKNNFVIINEMKGGRLIGWNQKQKHFFNKVICLDSKDALKVLKAIYVFSGDKGTLNNIYKQAKEFYKSQK